MALDSCTNVITFAEMKVMVDDDDASMTGSFWENYSPSSPSADSEDDSVTDDSMDDGVSHIEIQDYPSSNWKEEAVDDLWSYDPWVHGWDFDVKICST